MCEFEDKLLEYMQQVEKKKSKKGVNWVVEYEKKREKMLKPKRL